MSSSRRKKKSYAQFWAPQKRKIAFPVLSTQLCFCSDAWQQLKISSHWRMHDANSRHKMSLVYTHTLNFPKFYSKVTRMRKCAKDQFLLLVKQLTWMDGREFNRFLVGIARRLTLKMRKPDAISSIRVDKKTITSKSTNLQVSKVNDF